MRATWQTVPGLSIARSQPLPVPRARPQILLAQESLITTHHRSSVSNSSKAILCGCCGCGCCAPELRLGVRYQGNRASRCESHDQDHQFEHHLQGYPITLIGQLVRLSALELKAETKKYKIFKISQDFFQNAKSAEDFLFGR